MRFTKCTLVVLSLGLAIAAFTVPAVGKKRGTANQADAVAAITEMENAAVKADTSGDSSFVEKNYADNFTAGSSWGNWETKQSILADMKDSKNNKTNTEEISDLSVRLYGDTAIATYKSTMIRCITASIAQERFCRPILLSGRMVHGKKLRATVPNSPSRIAVARIPQSRSAL